MGWWVDGAESNGRYELIRILQIDALVLDLKIEDRRCGLSADNFWFMVSGSGSGAALGVRFILMI